MPKKKTEDSELILATEETTIDDIASESDAPPEDTASEPVPAVIDETPSPKPRTARKKRLPNTEDSADTPAEESSPPPKAPKPSAASRKRAAAPSVLTIEAHDEVETPEDREAIVWHEIQNAHRTKRILTGTLGGIERTENHKTLAVVYFKEFRIVIPMSEMMLKLSDADGQNYEEITLRQSRLLNKMLGADIDFIVKGIDAKARGVVASRKDAMLKKRQTFYMDTDAFGMYRVYEGRIVQARVVAVADKAIRVEVFGVECSISSGNLAWDWMGDAHERYSVGDQILVCVLSVKRNSLEDISVKADVKSLTGGSEHESLKKCRVQGKYAGRVTDVRKGVVYIRLSIGVNAVAHSCYDSRLPGKKDDVSFVVTRIDEEHNVAVGIITRIIKQNL